MPEQNHGKRNTREYRDIPKRSAKGSTVMSGEWWLVVHSFVVQMVDPMSCPVLAVPLTKLIQVIYFTVQMIFTAIQECALIGYAFIHHIWSNKLSGTQSGSAEGSGPAGRVLDWGSSGC